MDPIKSVYELVKSGQSGVVSLGGRDGQEIIVENEPRVVQDPVSGVWNYEPVLKRGPASVNEQGEKVIAGDYEYISYEELVEEFMNPLVRSGALGAF